MLYSAVWFVLEYPSSGVAGRCASRERCADPSERRLGVSALGDMCPRARSLSGPIAGIPQFQAQEIVPVSSTTAQLRGMLDL